MAVLNRCVNTALMCFFYFIWEIFCLKGGRITHCSQLDALRYKVLVIILKVGTWQIKLMLLSTKYWGTNFCSFCNLATPVFPWIVCRTIQCCIFDWHKCKLFLRMLYQGNVTAKVPILNFVLYGGVCLYIQYTVLGWEYFGTKSTKIFFHLNFVSYGISSHMDHVINLLFYEW